jgi:hypothetical protein
MHVELSIVVPCGAEYIPHQISAAVHILQQETLVHSAVQG